MTNLANSDRYPDGTVHDGPVRAGLTLVAPLDPDGPPLPTASQEYRDVLAGMEQLLADIAQRLERHPGTELPGIGDVGETVVLYAATTRRAAYGWYRADIWHHAGHGQRFAEIVLNADHLDRPADEVFRTLVHELVHAYAAATGINDTSRGGTYHNNRFGELAIRAGLVVERRPGAGCFTVGISPLGDAVYGDLVDDLDNLLTLHRTPRRRRRDTDTTGGDQHHPGAGPDTGTAPNPGKYVMAQCRCTGTAGRPVSIRVARGGWEPGVIWCRRCGHPFTNSTAEPPGSPDEWG